MSIPSTKLPPTLEEKGGAILVADFFCKGGLCVCMFAPKELPRFLLLIWSVAGYLGLSWVG